MARKNGNPGDTQSPTRTDAEHTATAPNNENSSSDPPDGENVKILSMWCDTHMLCEEAATAIMETASPIGMWDLSEAKAAEIPIVAAAIADIWIRKPKRGNIGYYRGVILVAVNGSVISGTGKALPDSVARMAKAAKKIPANLVPVAVIDRHKSEDNFQYQTLNWKWQVRKTEAQKQLEASAQSEPRQLTGDSDDGSEADSIPF